MSVVLDWRNQTRFIAARKCRVGLTVVEVLVAIGVVGLLMAIALPAIQGSREASRRATCCSHQHQLAIASQHHVSVHGVYPGSTYGPFTDLLSYVEAQMPTNEARHRIEVYQCPDEPHEAWGDAWDMSYRMNNGSQIHLDPTERLPATGVHPDGAPLRPRDVTDGESNTAMYSERMYIEQWLNTSQPTEVLEIYRRNPVIWIWRVGATYIHGDEDAYTAACLDPSRRSTFRHPRPFVNPDLFTLSHRYDHLLPPNVPGCSWVEPPAPVLTWSIGFSNSNPANSGHPGGVVMAYCDGGTKFIGNSVDLAVWRAIGTRAGSESVRAP
jgi:hypothetical protein